MDRVIIVVYGPFTILQSGRECGCLGAVIVSVLLVVMGGIVMVAVWMVLFNPRRMVPHNVCVVQGGQTLNFSQYSHKTARMHSRKVYHFDGVRAIIQNIPGDHHLSISSSSQGSFLNKVVQVTRLFWTPKVATSIVSVSSEKDVRYIVRLVWRLTKQY